MISTDQLIRLSRKYRFRIVATVACCAVLLTILSVIANIMWIERLPGSGIALVLFSLDREMSVGTWWAATMLAGLGLLTWLVYLLQTGVRKSEKYALLVLAAGFVFLSIDETCMLHERIGGKVHVEGLLHHARWSIMWLPPALIVCGIVMWRLWRSRKHLVLGICLGIVIYLAGAVGVETYNSAQRVRIEDKLGLEAAYTIDANQSFVPTEWRRDRAYYPYVIGTSIEEFLEMLGPVIWLWVLLDWRNVVAPGETAKSATPTKIKHTIGKHPATQ